MSYNMGHSVIAAGIDLDLDKLTIALVGHDRRKTNFIQV